MLLDLLFWLSFTFVFGCLAGHMVCESDNQQLNFYKFPFGLSKQEETLLGRPTITEYLCKEENLFLPIKNFYKTGKTRSNDILFLANLWSDISCYFITLFLIV